MAKKINILIEQGADFNLELDVKHSNNSTFDLSGFTASVKLKKHYSSTQEYELTTEFTNRVGGQIRISANNSLTETIIPGRYSYDVEVESENNVKTRVIEGTATVTPGIS